MAAVAQLAANSSALRSAVKEANAYSAKQFDKVVVQNFVSFSSRRRSSSLSIVAAIATDSPSQQADIIPPQVKDSPLPYTIPTWARFELGLFPLFWETDTGAVVPSGGDLVTIWFNPSATSMEPNPEFGFAFNGGFNGPIMCGGEARQMTRKDRGPKCASFYTIKVNVPLHATNIQFSFTNGTEWNGPYRLNLQIPDKWKGQSVEFFNRSLAGELNEEGACESTIFPDAAFVPTRCLMPGGIGLQQGQSCELDLNPGCTDPESPFFDPLANVDDGSCPIDVPEPINRRG
eukprot:TRINITY_DN288_c0_g1_i2.p1 TRINITY_DN288_c0_g1~~TRINITY_DN288_c0_g1_i2.p1  ORF type:complete len:296 (-),score=68.72 TRINITY_DN288_c0_g1_i2:313-1179(-)